jgi:type I restriction enzyme, S subunit
VRQDCKPRADDVLVAKDGHTRLKHVFPTLYPQEVVVLSSVAILRPGPRLLPLVLTLYLRDPETKERLLGLSSGVAIPRIVLKDFKIFSLPLAPTDLQVRFDTHANPMLRQAALLERSNGVLREARDLLLPRLISGEIDVSNLDIGNAEPAA